jgi:hypothetical protein
MTLDLAFRAPERDRPDLDADRADVTEQARAWAKAEPNVVGYRVVKAEPAERMPGPGMWTVTLELDMREPAPTLGLFG